MIIIIACESKLDIFQLDLETKTYKYFTRLQNNLEGFKDKMRIMKSFFFIYFKLFRRALQDFPSLGNLKKYIS